MKFSASINLHTKFGPDRFSRIDVYWIQTNKQRINIYMRPSSISIVNMFFLCNLKQKQTKNFVDFQNFPKSNFVTGKFFENSIIHNPSLGSCEVKFKVVLIEETIQTLPLYHIDNNLYLFQVLLYTSLWASFF